MENSAPGETFLSFFPHVSAFPPPSPPPTKKACSLNTKNKTCLAVGWIKIAALGIYFSSSNGFSGFGGEREMGWDGNPCGGGEQTLSWCFWGWQAP